MITDVEAAHLADLLLSTFVSGIITGVFFVWLFRKSCGKKNDVDQRDIMKKRIGGA